MGRLTVNQEVHILTQKLFDTGPIALFFSGLEFLPLLGSKCSCSTFLLGDQIVSWI